MKQLSPVRYTKLEYACRGLMFAAFTQSINLACTASIIPLYPNLWHSPHTLCLYISVSWYRRFWKESVMLSTSREDEKKITLENSLKWDLCIITEKQWIVTNGFGCKYSTSMRFYRSEISSEISLKAFITNLKFY